MKKPEVVILCGGKSTRLNLDRRQLRQDLVLNDQSAVKPKPLIEIGGRPILWHIMKIYAHYGYKKFILCLGFQGEYIKKYFCDYRMLSSEFTLIMDPLKDPEIHSTADHLDWEITFVDTGIDTQKGGRLKRAEKYIKSDNFHVTYGDGVANIDINKLFDYHVSHKRIGTVTGVKPPSRFGELTLSEGKVIRFEEKPQLETGIINGGFFVFKKEFLDYLTPDIDCDLEFGALQRLAQEGELQSYIHDGFWQCVDTARDKDYMDGLWSKNRADWKVWNE